VVGICLRIGRCPADVDRLSPELQYLGSESTARFVEAPVGITSAYHRADRGGHGAETGSDRVWAWGDVAGFDGAGDYRPRDESTTESLSAYCAELYETYGDSAFEGFNGRFVVVIYNSETGRLRIATDRFGSRPVYRFRTDDALVFSTAIQALTRLGDEGPGFAPRFLAEYFGHQRTFGHRTPFSGVDSLPPASVTTVDTATLDLSSDRYWYPTYDPVDRPVSYFIRRLAALLRAAVLDRTREERTCGLLLSGGSDSRAILAAADQRLRTYHFSSWSNRHLQTAAQVAAIAGVPFEPLVRDREYYVRALDRNAALSNFVDTFAGGHATGYEDRIRNDVDTLLVGHLADVFFGAHYLPRRRLSLGPLGSPTLPVAKRMRDPKEYVEWRSQQTPEYFLGPSTTGAVMSREIRADGDDIVSHGERYRSLRDLADQGSYYPLSNALTFFEDSLDQLLPCRNPFFDTRLIDLSLRIPRPYLLRRNLVGQALSHLDDELAAVAHAETGVALSRPFPVQYAGELATDVANRFHGDRLEDHWSHGPWDDQIQLVRSHPFIGDLLDSEAEVIEALPFLDPDAVERCYHAHLGGENRLGELYTLATVLRMPATKRIVDEPPSSTGSGN
jgi:asparagine synthase (glutamine-hydrolysing)